MSQLIKFLSIPQPQHLHRIYSEFRGAWLAANDIGPVDWDHQFRELGICDFLLNETEEKVEIYIRLKRPGLLIGIRGKCYDHIVEHLKTYFNKAVDFIIEEPQPFL